MRQAALESVVAVESQDDVLCFQTHLPQGYQPGSLQRVMEGRSGALWQILGAHSCGPSGLSDPIYVLGLLVSQ